MRKFAKIRYHHNDSRTYDQIEMEKITVRQQGTVARKKMPARPAAEQTFTITAHQISDSLHCSVNLPLYYSAFVHTPTPAHTWLAQLKKRNLPGSFRGRGVRFSCKRTPTHKKNEYICPTWNERISKLEQDHGQNVSRSGNETAWAKAYRRIKQTDFSRM